MDINESYPIIVSYLRNESSTGIKVSEAEYESNLIIVSEEFNESCISIVPPALNEKNI